MRYAFVTTNLLDLRKRPQFNSERLSQLFFGEVIQVGAERLGYVNVVQADGYAGWVDKRFLKPISQKAARIYRKYQSHVVVTEKTIFYQHGTTETPAPHYLYYGTRLGYRYRRKGLATCVLPDETAFQLKEKHLKPINAIKATEVTPRAVVRETLRFLGVPYLWGGISPAGFDCSGLMRTVFGRFGIYLPRDTKDQMTIGTTVKRSEIKIGDLVFFQRHVGLALDRDRIVHASLGGSGARINSLVPGTDDYRADLDHSFATARRIL